MVSNLQCTLEKEGAVDLIVDLIIRDTNNINNKVFQETVKLGIALLEGGNTEIQVGTHRGREGERERGGTDVAGSLEIQTNAVKPV